MLKTKSFVSVLLVILSMLPVNLASCGGGGNDGVNQTNAEGGGDEFLYKADYLPAADYGGYEFRIMSWFEEEGAMRTAADKEYETGEVVNDAIYTRNRLIESRYNIKFRDMPRELPVCSDLFKQSVRSGSDDFDLCALPVHMAFNCAIDGMITPVSDLPYADTTRPWYARKLNDDLTIGGKMYFAYSDEALNMFEQANVVCFNKKMAENFRLGDIYALVNEGKWTFDKFFEMANLVTDDIDGDGAMTDADRYGIISEGDIFYPNFWEGAGVKLVEKDDEGIPYFAAPSNTKLFNVLEYAYNSVFGGKKIYFDTAVDSVTKYPSEGRATTRRMFSADAALFYVTYLGNVQYLSEMQSDFGIVPFPKYNEEQTEYYARCMEGIIHLPPVHAKNKERTSVIMEALAVESKNYTVPAYYEVALKYKHSRDDESANMLDLIYESRTMDLGDTIWRTEIGGIYLGAFMEKRNNFASSTDRSKNSMEKLIENALKKIDKLD